MRDQNIVESSLLDDFPNEFFCPITLDLMVKPVVAADGNSYEYEAIRSWLIEHDRSPLTNQSLPNMNLVNNNALRKLIEDFKVKVDKLNRNHANDLNEQQNSSEQKSDSSSSLMAHGAFFNSGEREKLCARSVSYLVEDIKRYLSLHLSHKIFDKEIEFSFAEKTIDALCDADDDDSFNLINELRNADVPQQVAYYIQFYVLQHPDLEYAKIKPAFGRQIADDLSEKDLNAIRDKAGIVVESNYLKSLSRC